MNENELIARIEILEKEVQSMKEIIAVLSKNIEIPSAEKTAENPEIITTFYKLNDDEIKNLTSAVNRDFQIENNILIEYNGNDSVVIIPEGVTEIAEKAFYRCEILTNVSIPESVTKIGENAFGECCNLKTINIPKCITEINRWTFFNCKNLKKINIPDSVTKIGTCAFWGCKCLVISIPENCIYNKNSFDFCEKVIYRGNKKLIQKEKSSVNEINSDFEIKNNILVKYNGNDSMVTIPYSVTEIGEEAFKGCNNLQEIYIPYSISKIGKAAFYLCINLHNVQISYGVKEIDDWAFYRCERLKEIIIPNSIIKIGNSSFDCCHSLEKIIISDSITKIGRNSFFSCENLKSIYIPNKIKEIGSQAFCRCRNLIISVPKKCKCAKDSFLHCKQVIYRG